VSYAHRSRKKAIKRGKWNLQPMIDRFKRQGRDDVVTLLIKRDAK